MEFRLILLYTNAHNRDKKSKALILLQDFLRSGELIKRSLCHQNTKKI